MESNRSISALSLLTICSLLLCLCSTAQAAGPQTIRGTIYTPSGAPVKKRVRVVLTNASGVDVAETFSQATGSFAFSEIEAGNYRVTVFPDNPNYAPTTEQVNMNSASSAGAAVTVNIFLKLKEPAHQAAPGVVSAFSQTVPEEARKEYQQANKHLKKGKTEAGIACLKRAIEIFPDYYQALDRLGNEYLLLGQSDEAVQPLTQAIEINPKSYSSNLALGVCMIRLKRFDRAVELLKMAVSLDLTSIPANMFLGAVLIEAGNLDDAEQCLKRAHSLGDAGQTSAAHLHLANLYQRKADYQRAADELEIYLRDVPDSDKIEQIQAAIKSLRIKQSQSRHSSGRIAK